MGHYILLNSLIHFAELDKKIISNFHKYPPKYIGFVGLADLFQMHFILIRKYDSYENKDISLNDDLQD